MADRPRRLLRRLVADKRINEQPILALRLLDAMRVASVGPHPFDYPALVPWMNLDRSAIGKDARDWLERHSSKGESSGVSDMDVSNWREYPPAERVGFLQSLRQQDPRAARELLSASFGQETAVTRAKLLATMAVGLSLADEAFLVEAAKGRAQTVAAMATRLLARIPGSTVFAARLAAATALVSLETTRGKQRLRIDLPKGMNKEHLRWQWIREQFDGVDPKRFAAALHLALPAFVDLLTDRHLRCVIYAEAIRSGQLDVAQALATGMSELQRWTIKNQFVDEISSLDEAAATFVMNDLVRPEDWRELSEGLEFAGAMYEAVRVPLSPAKSEAILISPACKAWFRDPVKRHELGDWLTLVVAVTHRDCHAKLTLEISQFPPAVTLEAQAAIELLASLPEKA